jgi:hypothetical protein
MTPVQLSADEFILRRIHKSHSAPLGPQIILPAAFRPSQEDITGLSVFREHLVTAAEVAAAGRKPGEYYVARLSVRTLRDLGFTVIDDDQPNGLRGHALIPELGLEAYQRNKSTLKCAMAELARQGSQAIVHHPDN